MVTVEQACEIETRESRLPYILGITDVGHGYTFGSSSCNMPIPGYSSIVYKATGKRDIYPFFDHEEEIRNGKDVPVPKRFQCPDAEYKDGILVD